MREQTGEGATFFFILSLALAGAGLYGALKPPR